MKLFRFNVLKQISTLKVRNYGVISDADYKHKQSSVIRNRIYAGELDIIMGQRFIDEYASETSAVKRAGLITKQAARRLYGEFVLKKELDGFNLNSFKIEAENLYKTLNLAITEGDLITLSNICTMKYMTEIKKYARQENKRRTKLKWELIKMEKTPSIVDVIVASFEGIKGNTELVAQITLMFNSKQRLTRMVVFERYLKNPFDIWKIAGRMQKYIGE
ncbi:hypothetical protein ROZALSC1DRAFT_30165 [Rozella allomycis CSF55]|uniref:Uncharacterized protein n=1 Tax=Rozella allomycis (strain CSF55) TaxID=988480 RepID=A0A4P9YFQ6_ROZAC|nr:hypothetical protein ROZALSC1DRAFT_30165 [Rozella allomycis CSF55]